MTTYLVTGGAGFIGSHMVDALLKRGKQVRVLDNFFSGKRENLSAFREQIELIEGDARDTGDCGRAVEGVDAVIHLAAPHEVVRSVECPMEAHEVNVTGTLNMLLAARNAGVRKFVFASSSAIYGENPAMPRLETMTPAPTASPYGVTKMTGEYYCRMFSSLYGLDTACVRYFNVYGPRQDADSTYAAVIPKFWAALLARIPPTIYGDGSQSRDFTYVADCVAATLADCETAGLKGEVFNVGTGRRTTVNELCATMQQLLGTNLTPNYGPTQPGDLPHDRADIGKAVRVLGYQPRYDLLRGLQEMIRAMELAQPAGRSAATLTASI